MDSMIHGLCPSLGVWLQIFVLWQSRFELGEGVVLVAMPEHRKVVQLHDPRWCGRVVIVISFH